MLNLFCFNARMRFFAFLCLRSPYRTRVDEKRAEAQVRGKDDKCRIDARCAFQGLRHHRFVIDGRRALVD